MTLCHVLVTTQQTTVYEQRAQKLLEQMEVGKTDEERVLIVKKCSKYENVCMFSASNNFHIWRVLYLSLTGCSR